MHCSYQHTIHSIPTGPEITTYPRSGPGRCRSMPAPSKHQSELMSPNGLILLANARRHSRCSTGSYIDPSPYRPSLIFSAMEWPIEFVGPEDLVILRTNQTAERSAKCPSVCEKTYNDDSKELNPHNRILRSTSGFDRNGSAGERQPYRLAFAQRFYGSRRKTLSGSFRLLYARQHEFGWRSARHIAL